MGKSRLSAQINRMIEVQEIAPQSESFLGAVLQSRSVFADAYVAACDPGIGLKVFLRAFYTSKAFWPERVLLGLIKRGSTSQEALEAMIEGRSDRFGVWRVVQRDSTEILLRDTSGRTASWLAVRDGQVMFGSIVYPRVDSSGTERMGALFWALKGFHKAYSRVLLASAVRRLRDV